MQWLAVQDQDALIMDAWQGLAGSAGVEADVEWGSGPVADSAGSSGGTGQEVQGCVTDATSIAGAVQLEIRAGDEGSAAAGASGQGPLLRPAAEEPGNMYNRGSSSSSRGQRPPAVSVSDVHHPASAFDVTSPTPAAASGLPSAAAAWFSSSYGLAPAHPSPTSAAAVPAGSDIPSDAAAGSSSNKEGASCSGNTSTGSGFPNCPTLVFVVTQEDVVDSMVKAPLLFHELDTLDLTGLGIADAGAMGMARVLEQSPGLRRVVLADNKIGEEGGAALAAAMTLNTTLQVRLVTRCDTGFVMEAPALCCTFVAYAFPCASSAHLHTSRVAYV